MLFFFQKIINYFYTFSNWIAIKHMFFTLPFILVHLMFNYNAKANFEFIPYVLAAFFFARNFAMATNRILDFYWDSRNPRTQNRELVTQKISHKQAYIFLFLNGVFFSFVCFWISFVYFLLSPFLLLGLGFYSFWKRFSKWSHFYLGFIISFSLTLPTFVIYQSLSFENILLFFAVMFWIIGFDSLYSILDISFDRKEKLYSIASAWGEKKTISLFRILNFLFVFLFVFIGILSEKVSTVYDIFLFFIFLHLFRQEKKIRNKEYENLLNENLRISFFYFLGCLIDFLILKDLLHLPAL